MSDLDENDYYHCVSDFWKFRNINKSPVLYLRRRRDIDYNRPFEMDAIGKRYKDHNYTEGSTYGGENPGGTFGDSTEPVWKFDDGSIYPNHFSKSRLGNVELVKSRDYKRRYPEKWIHRQQLIIDGNFFGGYIQ
jgi:hypothetical protein